MKQSAGRFPCRIEVIMKKMNILLTASLAALTLMGGALVSSSVSAADYGQPPKMEAQQGQPPQFENDNGQRPQYKKDHKKAPKVKKDKSHKDKNKWEEPKQEKQAKSQKKLKPWEEKYYEQHPEAREQDEHKGNPEKKNFQDDDGNNWHRL